VGQPVGVFDSGVGGLTVLRELVRVLPGESFVYFGDTARVPYGTKSRETITRYSVEIANYLVVRHEIKMLVVACNTASSLALPALRKIYRIPVVGMIDPSVRRVAALPKRDAIGVIGTSGTIRSGAYEQALRSALPKARIRCQPCPLLVSLAEEGWIERPVTRDVVAEYLAPFRPDPPDALILGCTHYPVLKKTIAEFLGDGTVLVDSGEEAARVVDVLISESGMKKEERIGAAIRFLVTDDPGRFADVGEAFLGGRIADVENVML
jgi:glutamate racemase